MDLTAFLRNERRVFFLREEARLCHEHAIEMGRARVNVMIFAASTSFEAMKLTFQGKHEDAAKLTRFAVQAQKLATKLEHKAVKESTIARLMLEGAEMTWWGF